MTTLKVVAAGLPKIIDSVTLIGTLVLSMLQMICQLQVTFLCSVLFYSWLNITWVLHFFFILGIQTNLK
jgi:hypothetical protein